MSERYVAWLDYVFDRVVPDEVWDIDDMLVGFEADAETTTDLITVTMLRCGEDLARFSDEQVNQGLNYIFNNSRSDAVFSILDGKFSWDRKREAILSIKTLYTDCFDAWCTPTLSHLDELGATPLNAICYMLWDITPLAFWGERSEKKEGIAAVLEVLEFALTLKNLACVESALHGLGHLYDQSPGRVVQIVQRFISKSHIQSEKLLAYARNALSGNIQ